MTTMESSDNLLFKCVQLFALLGIPEELKILAIKKSSGVLSSPIEDLDVLETADWFSDVHPQNPPAKHLRIL